MVLGSATILITSVANLNNHVTVGKFPIIKCDDIQFKKYVDMRVDVQG